MARYALVPEMPPGEDELPTDDGVPMESWYHRTQMNILCDTLAHHWRDRHDFYIAGNQPIYFSAQQIKQNDFLGPDVAIILNTTDRPRKSWVVWYEERTPDVVIELLSPRTEANDRGHKMQVYAGTLKVDEYYLYDPIDGDFEAYELQHGMYVAVLPDEEGRVYSRKLGLYLAQHDSVFGGETVRFLRWFTAEGELIRTDREDFDAASSALSEERARAEQARAKADEERARAEQARAQADEERARAEQAGAQAEQQRARAEALAAKLRALGLDPEA